MTATPWTAEHFETIEGDHRWPFCEDENGNITGYGHQNRAAFADAVEEYDLVMGYADPDDPDVETWEVRWEYAKPCPDDDEHLHVCDSSDPGAQPITTIWGQR